MITNFEKYTEEVTPNEVKNIIPHIVRMLRKALNKKNAITNSKIKENLKFEGIITRPERIRKMIQYIRLTGLVRNVLSNSKGYYISVNPDEIERFIESQMQRIEQMQATLDAVQWQWMNAKKYPAICSVTGKPLNDGYVVGGNIFSSRDDADTYCKKHNNGKSFDELYSFDSQYCYYTIFNKSKDYYYDENGLLVDKIKNKYKI